MAGKLPDLDAVNENLTSWEWDEFNRLSDKRDLNDDEMERWIELETKATKHLVLENDQKEREWNDFLTLCDKRPELTEEEFTRLITLEDRISAVEAYERLKAEFDVRKRGLVTKSILSFVAAYMGVLFLGLIVMGWDGQRRRDKEADVQAKVAALFPSSDPECIAWPKDRLPLIGITTSFEYNCDYRRGKAPEGIDFVRIEGTEAVAYRSITVTETTERAVDSVEVKRFAIELP